MQSITEKGTWLIPPTKTLPGTYFPPLNPAVSHRPVDIAFDAYIRGREQRGIANLLRAAYVASLRLERPFLVRHYQGTTFACSIHRRFRTFLFATFTFAFHLKQALDDLAPKSHQQYQPPSPE